MKTQLEDISPIKKRLKVEVLPEIVTRSRDLAVRKVQKKAEMPGFRAGKVPAAIIEQKFLREVQRAAIEAIVDETLLPALQVAQVRPVSRPEIEPGMWQADGGFSYQAVFEVLPLIPLKEKDYQGLKLEKEEVAVSAEEIEAELKRLQQAMTQLEPLPDDTVVAQGHVAILDYRGKADGKAFSGGEAKDFAVEVGAGGLLKEFETGLIGLKKGEKKNIQFSYPKDYFNKELAGKRGEFEITLQSVRRKNVPPLDDEFAKDLGNFKNLSEVKADVERRIAAAKESQQKNNLIHQIIRQLVEKNKFEIPPSLVAGELQHMLHELAHDLEKQGEDIRKLDIQELAKRFQPQAEFRVASFLMLNQLCDTLNIAVAQAEVEQWLEQTAKAMGKPLAEVKAFYQKENRLGPLQTRLRHEKALEFVLKQSKIRVVKPKNDQKSVKKA